MEDLMITGYDGSKVTTFGHLDPRWVKRIDIYSVRCGLMIRSYYYQDLNEIIKRTHNQYFIDRVPVKLVSDCGYVEYIGGKHA